jgi:hypothetical protein
MTFRAAFYKGTHSGLPGVYNRAVRAWTRSSYSHVELSFSSGYSGSSSYMDGGVRLKVIDFDPMLWDFIKLPTEREHMAFQWFLDHRGEKYDLLGNVHFMVAPVEGSKDKWFCSESIAAALGLPEPWRYDPATLASAMHFLNQPASAGFSF